MSVNVINVSSRNIQNLSIFFLFSIQICGRNPCLFIQCGDCRRCSEACSIHEKLPADASVINADGLEPCCTSME